MNKEKATRLLLTKTSDDLGNPIVAYKEVGSFWCDYLVPVGERTIRETYGLSTAASHRTFTFEKVEVKQILSIQNKKYVVNESLRFPNGVYVLLVEVLKNG